MATSGDHTGARKAAPPFRSRLRVRLPADAISAALPLAGKALDIAGANVRLGPPAIHPLVPAAAVESRLVTFKDGNDPEAFLATARAKLAALGVAGEPAVRAFASGPRAGQLFRRVVRLKGRAIVGYALVVSGLTANESIHL